MAAILFRLHSNKYFQKADCPVGYFGLHHDNSMESNVTMRGMRNLSEGTWAGFTKNLQISLQTRKDFFRKCNDFVTASFCTSTDMLSVPVQKLAVITNISFRW